MFALKETGFLRVGRQAPLLSPALSASWPFAKSCVPQTFDFSPLNHSAGSSAFFSTPADEAPIRSGRRERTLFPHSGRRRSCHRSFEVFQKASVHCANPTASKRAEKVSNGRKHYLYDRSPKYFTCEMMMSELVGQNWTVG
jgi:hypothetical protein